MLQHSNFNSSGGDKKRPTKISRYFKVTPSEKSICRMFNTLNIQLMTTYYAKEQRTAYSLYLQNFDKLNITAAEISEVTNEQYGDLMAFHDTLKYLVYHPSLTKKLNNYDFVIHTNSTHIASNLETEAETETTEAEATEANAETTEAETTEAETTEAETTEANAETTEGNNLTKNILALYSCIKNISVVLLADEKS